jgi:hypothetical protein
MNNTSTAEELSHDLRCGDSRFLNRRRNIIGLSLFSCAILGTVALYQVGILKRLPEPRSKFFDTARVNGSSQAYSIFSTPDAFLGLASYAVTAGLAGMGAENRSRTHPWMAVAMGGKLIADATMAGKLTMDELRKLKAFSLWSVLTALATWSALPLAFPETKAAVRQLMGWDDDNI